MVVAIGRPIQWEVQAWTLRFTPYPQTMEHDKYCQSKFTELFGEDVEWLGGRETAKNIHYHFVFWKQNLDPKEFQKRLYEIMKVEKIGNTTYSLKPAVDLKKSMAYALKDGEHFHSIGLERRVKEYFAISKKKKQSSKELMADLQSSFNKDLINERTLWIELCKGRAYLGIPHKSSTINELVETMKINKNPNYATELWEQQELKKIKL